MHTVRKDGVAGIKRHRRDLSCDGVHCLGVVKLPVKSYETPHQKAHAFVKCRLPSSIFNAKSPFELVYGLKPKLFHLRSFGCLCFSSVLNSFDKFSARDVKFYETAFPFQMNYSLQQVKENYDNNVNNLNFFDEKHSDSQTSLSPNDDGRGNYAPNDKGNDYHYTTSSLTFDGSEDNIAASMGENISSKGHVSSSFSGLNTQDFPEIGSQVQPSVRRSSRPSKMPPKFNDYIVGSNVKYGLEKYACYAKLNTSNYSLSNTLNKSFEPICDLPKRRKPIRSKWMFKIKYKSTSEIERYKARLVAKGFSQREEFDYLETFSPAVMMSTVRCMLNMVSKFDYSLFTKNSGDVFVALVVYVDDIVITGNNLSEIEKFKVFLKSKIHIKDLGKLKKFLGIEVLDNADGICLSQRKCCLELLYDYGLLATKHVDTPLPENTTPIHIESDDDKLLSDIENYQRHVGSLGNGVQISRNDNLKLRAYADSDWAICPATRKSIFGSSAEAEYKSIASVTCEVIWLSNLLSDMGVKELLSVVLYYDDSYALQIVVNRVFHEKSKHFEIDVHFLGYWATFVLCEKLGLLEMFQVEKLEGGVKLFDMRSECGDSIFVPKSCSACSRVFAADIYGDYVVSCDGIVGIKHRHNIVRDTLVDIYFRSGISAGKEVDIVLSEGQDKPLHPADMLLYSLDGGLDVCVDLTRSSPLTQTRMIDPVFEAAQRKRTKYEAKCVDIGYGFLPFSFYSFEELKKDAMTLLKRIRGSQ
ncbi:ribonuclease H-like domain-containing protein [Tanacetum coccineum]